MEFCDDLIAVLGTLAGTFAGWGLSQLTERRNISKKKNAVFIELTQLSEKLNKVADTVLSIANNLCSNKPSDYLTLPMPVRLEITDEFFKQVYIRLSPSERANVSGLREFVDTLNDAIAVVERAKEPEYTKQQYFDMVLTAYGNAIAAELYARETIQKRKEVVDLNSPSFIAVRKRLNETYCELHAKLVK
ncbi:MAG: hypothetical protein AB1780_11585 [Pseudomonadota bacterium]